MSEFNINMFHVIVDLFRLDEIQGTLIDDIRSEIGLVNVMSSEHKDQYQRISLIAVDIAMDFVLIVMTWQNS